MYKTSFTVEQLVPESDNDIRQIASNCNAITFRAHFINQDLRGKAGFLGLYSLVAGAPQVSGITLLPGLVQDLKMDDNGLIAASGASGQRFLLQNGPQELVFEAGHPEALDTTVYQVRLQRVLDFSAVGVTVIRRFITR